MTQAETLRRLFEDAHQRATREDDPRGWANWLDQNGKRLVRGFGQWLEVLRRDKRPRYVPKTTAKMLSLWSAPGVPKRRDIVQVVVRYAGECPATLGTGFDFGQDIPSAVGKVLRARASQPNKAAQQGLWAASKREDLGWGTRVVFARFAFPYKAAALRQRLLDTDFTESAIRAHQSWLLRFADHPEFAPTWGAMFESADWAERRVMLAAAEDPDERTALLPALAWVVARRPFGPAPDIARYAAQASGGPAVTFLTWYAVHGPPRGVAPAVEGLAGAGGDGVRAALDQVARHARDPTVADRARALRDKARAGDPPGDRHSRRIRTVLGDGADPGGLTFAERQLLGAAWDEAQALKGAAPLTDGERGDLLGIARALVARLGREPEVAPEWGREAVTILCSAPWEGVAEALPLVVEAAGKRRNPKLQRTALRALLTAAEAGRLRLTPEMNAALERIADRRLGEATAYRLACLRLVQAPAAWRRAAADRLGDTPPTGLQRFVLAQPPEDGAPAALGVLFEACSAVQRRGLLADLQSPVDPAFLPVYAAVAGQATPQTAAAAARALGRVGDRDTLALLYRLRASRPELEGAVDEGLATLRDRLGPVVGAQAGALAVSHGEAGALSEPGGSGGRDAGRGGDEAAPLTLSLQTHLAFERMAPPPRRVPLTLWFIYLAMGPSRWGLLWSGWLALAAFSGLSAAVYERGWILALGSGGLGLLVHHWMADTVLHLRLLRGGYSASAQRVRYWTRWVGAKGNRSKEHIYDFDFVAEDGQTHEVRVESSKRREALNDEAAEGVLYLMRGGTVGPARPLDTLRPAQVDPDGRLGARWPWLLWALAAFAPWPFVVLEALGL